MNICKDKVYRKVERKIEGATAIGGISHQYQQPWGECVNKSLVQIDLQNILHLTLSTRVLCIHTKKHMKMHRRYPECATPPLSGSDIPPAYGKENCNGPKKACKPHSDHWPHHIPSYQPLYHLRRDT